MQHARPVAVDDALGVARRAGRVADHRGRVLVERGPVEVGRPRRRGAPRSRACRRGRAGRRRRMTMTCADARDALRELLEERQERAVDEDDACPPRGARCSRSRSGAGAGSACGRRAPIMRRARSTPRGAGGGSTRASRRGRPACTPSRASACASLRGARVDVGPRVAVERAVGPAADDLRLREVAARALEQVRERQREVHHPPRSSWRDMLNAPALRASRHCRMPATPCCRLRRLDSPSPSPPPSLVLVACHGQTRRQTAPTRRGSCLSTRRRTSSA